jgi:two-component system chemotaxis response regulator CheY
MGQPKKLRTLIADDEAHIRDLLKIVMNSMNAEIVGEAKNGKEAVEMYRREKPNLLLLDINMPVKTGEEALEEIMSEFPDALVIMLTAALDMETVEKCIELGASNYIRKDTSVAETKKLIKETWDWHKKS